MILKRVRVEISGAVQGVGFRPFVYRLASELSLTGWVINDSRGVFIEAEGPEATLRQFLQRLSAEKPARAIIQNLQSAWSEAVGYQRFEIRHSDDQGRKTVLVLPDIAICPDCLAEIRNPADRRYRYPFTNCTNCGPRFSIIQALPYDRPHTSMHRFVMCPACQSEYEDPSDRRFHAQPNACPVCGPRLALWTRPTGEALPPETPHHGRPGATPHPRISAKAAEPPPGEAPHPVVAVEDDALRATATALRAGQIVAVKGLGGFHLMVDARHEEAVARLRERKPRRDKPFAIMVRDLDQAHQICQVPPEAEALLTSPEAPIVLLRRRPGAPVADQVAPGNPYLGVMLPYTPLHHLLLAEVGFPVVATSGNLTDEPICTDEWEALARLGTPLAGTGQAVADLFLVHDRPIVRHVDDSVAWIVEGEPRLLRRARGYAPLPVLLGRPAPTILAVGAHLKNTVALSVGRQVFISQHIGDLETPEAMTAFERVIADFLRLYEATPVAIVHDMHPDYLSTRWAQQRSEVRARRPETGAGILASLTSDFRPLIAVQHHHAHLAACLAENHGLGAAKGGVEGPVLGVTWDGAGYGTDGTIWGGEFLLGDAADFTRVAHLRPFRLPGGDATAHEPRRAALALLWEIYGAAALDMGDLAPVRAFSPAELRLLDQMLTRQVNCPVTTSAGRLFDGVAALLDLHQRVTFEGQAAMALEFAADTCEAEDGAYPIGVRDVGGLKLLDWQPLVEAVLADLRRGVVRGIIAARFHNTLAGAIVMVAERSAAARVALTGGCFQNRLLTGRASERLRRAGFEVLLHRQVPPNDGGISLGQIAVAAAKIVR